MAGVEEHMRELSRIMLTRVETLGEQLADRIYSRIDGYRTTPSARDNVRESCVANMTFVFHTLCADGEADLSPAEATGRQRAVEGIPLAAVMTAYRIGFRFMWESSVAAAREAGIPTESILEASARIFLSQDEFTQAMTGAYREQLTSQIMDREEERSALVEAVLLGRITDNQSLWEAADLLGLPTTGPYVVAAAEIPAIGKLGLPEIASKLAARDIRSAWRLLPDLQVGVVHLRQDATYGVLVEVLRRVATARVGLSPAFVSLAETGEGLRLARLAVTGKPSRDGWVSAFDDAPLAISVSRSLFWPTMFCTRAEASCTRATALGWKPMNFTKPSMASASMTLRPFSSRYMPVFQMSKALATLRAACGAIVVAAFIGSPSTSCPAAWKPRCAWTASPSPWAPACPWRRPR